MENILSQIESILFVASKPLTTKQIAASLGKKPEEILVFLETLIGKYNLEGSGINVLETNDTWQMATNPKNKDVVEKFVKDEITSELTKPQLETLTVIAYRTPITKPELEKIRGVNCSIIIRNLMLRGLIEEKNNDEKLAVEYSLTTEALRHLGITNVKELPDYESLKVHEHIEKILNDEEISATNIDIEI